MFSHRINEHTELWLMERHHAGDLFKTIDLNRQYLREWHPWVDMLRSVSDAEKVLAAWHQQYANNRGFYAGIWHKGQFCGVINHLNVDWVNRVTILSYWLDAGHQGKGIMTACCQAMVEHSFYIWKLNRVTIECVTENIRSRAIPERLGFKLEGIVRQAEWLHGRYADHLIYGLLRSEFPGMS
jgi:ribosomal-protein-serine acetyltransferase